MKDRSKLNVWVVDDSRSMREFAAGVLRELGVGSVECFDDGLAALGQVMLRQNAVDIVVCDLCMPKVDGMRVIQSLAELKSPPAIIVLSGLEHRIATCARILGDELGLMMLGQLSKPLAPDALEAMLDDYVERSASHARMVRSRQLTLDDVIGALDAGQLEVHYQPKVRMRDGRPMAFEALARLRGPNGDLLGAAGFIPILEAGGRVAALTERVLAQIVQQSDQWSNLGVAVNLSAAELENSELPEQIRELLAAHPGLSSRLTLELTETQAGGSASQAAVLSRLCMSGVGLSIDDYGTGHSSLARVQRIPFDELKIDRQFVAGASRDEASLQILRSSIDLGHRMGMRVVAEGVETWDDWRTALKAGCDTAQGFLVAPALAEHQLGEWAEQWRDDYRLHRHH